MILLNCALVGDRSVVSIIIEEWTTVALLKDAIKEKKMLNFPADELQFFWRRRTTAHGYQAFTDDVKKLQKGETTDIVGSLTQEDMEVQGESGLTRILAGMRPPSTDEIHVLVVVPEQSEDRSPAEVLLGVLLPHAFKNAPTTLAEQNKKIKDNLCNFYGCYRRKNAWVRCMVVDVAFPKSLVTASHSFSPQQ
ncbi:unnamed protein product [Phytophthora lilii]|uniref:Unnamed protein product n=1 Tax=Phytophthora lilii TaxID=2077276 RepID=A0A9W6WPS6_9STRA|nr:unnamed protein product [Phytophthora lilii]